ncbi:MAG: hypothetical protein HY660_07390 [Armatimonadetes bacterium]|nr:hypothetical protein [Armatimonadota bacterium]
MRKVLVVDDGTLTAASLRRHLRSRLAGTGARLSVVTLTRRTPRATGTARSPGVTDFVGDPVELAARVRGAEILAVHKAPVTAEVIAAAPGLRLIACARGGPVNVDVAAATRRGIPVANAPARAAEATADLTLAFILALARNVVPATIRVKTLGPRAWEYGTRSTLEGVDLRGKTLGIVGFGNVGRRVAARAAAFGMRVILCDPHLRPREVTGAGAAPVGLTELLRQSDFVTLHARTTPENAGMIAARQLRLMPRSAYLINTARGTLVNERDLYQALKGGRIRGAALDVMALEPPRRDNPLLRLHNVLITPHIGGKTRESSERAAQMIADEVDRFLAGARPMIVANPEPVR